MGTFDQERQQERGMEEQGKHRLGETMKTRVKDREKRDRKLHMGGLGWEG